ncbi:E3 ubiquitin-protein ligase ATL15-like protein [Carex littledalei]|uniref:E3 ubiquitin-protein ligase ATL15-like protein n=1 Tax=Carex littledalei TaxID=544730 RepID=A0A833VJ99_9POAL|nr:E3 ubiquitin-protein ligase ATL15-like protein [Carex littledalei]
MFGWGLNLVTTVIGFGMSAAFIIFVCARLICGRIRSTDSPIAPPYDIDIDLPSDLGQPIEHNFNGLEPLTIAAIPTINYNHLTFQSKDNAQCSICLGDYEEKEMLRVIPACHHNFHLVCIDLWLQKQSTCPICRLPLKDLFEGKCATASSPTALAPQTNSTIVDTPTWDRSTNQLITNAVSGDSVQVQVVVTSTY